MEDCSENLLSWLKEISFEEEVVPKDQVLIRLGEENDHLLLLHEGQLRVDTRAGESIIQNAPNILGEISYVTGGVASAHVRSASEVRISRIPFKAIDDQLDDLPTFRHIYSDLTRLCIRRISGAYHERYIALVAHDSRKSDLIDLVAANKEFFSSAQLVSTQNTSGEITENTGLQVARSVRSGLLGGDQQIGALVSEGLISAVIFLRDPLWAQPHSADVHALIRICELENIPLATNIASAEAIIRQLKESSQVANEE